MSDLTKRSDYVDVKSLKDVTEFSKELKAFVVQQGLFTPIQNKNYVNVEGWEFAGAAMGFFPVVTETTNLSSADEIKYLSKVEIVRITDGKVVGTAFAICSNKEKGRDKNDEFIILSMSQTRATGKAFRLCIGWVMKLAGYEAVPTEEMPSDGVSMYDLTAQEKELTRTIGRIRRAMEVENYDTPEAKRAFMKHVLGNLDEVEAALAAEAVVPDYDELQPARG